ncbi:mechanosensitive ion channel family protein [Marinomonas primoryensis]|jgi:MscS family membrane protein|uniref:Mechanosensitive ion channel family protein n=1 Tax=Marinomonas primoryensis TaxID=178399 RepID=A0A859CTK6_9GAMM|nr:mechanosensitive ion channel family protein [Marinomonas primoryensis]QKK79476.1 mechanosensitive ion channel protein MscS [Marinomonas primoryensis]|tara:strand:+ start:1368 stop:2510 length:1143 start_codon:yes stop_codon:yes gene_type:complete
MNWETMQIYLGLGDTKMHWVVRVFLVVLSTLIANFIATRILTRIDKQLEKTKTPWDNVLIHAAQKPIGVFIWLAGVTIAAEISGTEIDSKFSSLIHSIREVGVVIILTWFVLRCISESEKTLTNSSKITANVDYTTASAISKLLRASVVITSALVVLQTLGFSISGVLAFGGIGGIAVGFAAKDLLANFFGGLMVYLDRPFAIGDWIRSPDQNIEGTVEHIGWRQTRIRTFEKRPLYVPNSTFSLISVENPSRMTHRRLNETIGVRYTDFNVLPTILADIKDMISEHEDIDSNQTYMVNFNQFGPSSLDFFIYAYTKTVDWRTFHNVKEDVLFKAMKIIESHNAEVAFPTHTVHMANNSKMALMSEQEGSSEQASTTSSN